MANIVGNDGVDDVLIGTAENDSIAGLGGHDVLKGHAGLDTLAGGGGDDTLGGGQGDDVLDGGAGIDTARFGTPNGVTVDLAAGTATTAHFTDTLISIENAIGSDFGDVLTGGAGDNTLRGSGGDDRLVAGDGHDLLSGGQDDDTYVFAGGADGSVVSEIVIADIFGHDVIDASAATGPMRLSLESGGTIAGRTVTFAADDTSDAPLDLVFAQDLSGSFGDDIQKVRALLPDVIDAVRDFQPESRIGVTSFVDKPISPFGSSGDYAYRTDLALTDDAAAVVATYDGLRILSGNDGPESQFEALLQIAKRPVEVGWEPGTTRAVLLFTDATGHLAGDGRAAGITTPNDGDNELDGSPPSTGEDYPDLDQLREALLARGIVPIFAATADVTGFYQDVVNEFGFGAVVSLAQNSANIVDVVKQALSLLTNETVIEDVIGTDFRDHVAGGEADNDLRGRAGDDVLVGHGGDDLLLGAAGDDVLRGGFGADTMEGGAGADQFRFSVPNGKSPADRILDFTSGEDTLVLKSARFGIGEVTADNFVQNAAGVATAAAHRLVFDTDDGLLLFDADGSGDGAAVALARLDGVSSLSVADFGVV